MPFYKNTQTKKTINKNELEVFLNERDLEKIVIFENFTFNVTDNTDDFEFIEHIWSHGDKLYKLAQRYYKNINLFWVISLFNKKPTDADYQYGDIVYIPVNVRDFLREVRR